MITITQARHGDLDQNNKQGNGKGGLMEIRRVLWEGGRGEGRGG